MQKNPDIRYTYLHCRNITSEFKCNFCFNVQTIGQIRFKRTSDTKRSAKRVHVCITADHGAPWSHIIFQKIETVEHFFLVLVLLHFFLFLKTKEFSVIRHNGRRKKFWRKIEFGVFTNWNYHSHLQVSFQIDQIIDQTTILNYF